MPDPAAAPRKDPIPSLDGLRGIAVLLVVWQHVPLAVVPDWAGLAALYVQPGYLGVDVFFVLSGFLITRILLVDRARGWPLRYFLARRCLRIFPIFYLTVAVMAVVRPGPELPWVATYLANFWFVGFEGYSPLLHTWSLCVEEHYYLLWPALVYFAGPPAARRFALFVLVPGALLAAAWIVASEPLAEARAAVQMVTPCRMLSLAAGSLLAWSEGRLRAAPLRTAALALAVGALGWGTVYAGIVHPTLRPAFPVFWLAGFAALSAALVALGVALDGGRNPVSAALRLAPLRRVGRVSYGLYLYHPLVFFALDVHGAAPGHPPSAARVALAAVAAYALAELSFALVERPILRLQERFRAA